MIGVLNTPECGRWALEAENHEGWRVSVDEGEGRRGWALLRASLHDPLLVLNVESDVRGGPCHVCMLLARSWRALTLLSDFVPNTQIFLPQSISLYTCPVQLSLRQL